MTTTPAPPTIHLSDPAQLHRLERVVQKRSFAVLSTVSAAGYPHAAGVVYANVGTTLYVHTMRHSRKARNVEETRRAAVVIPTRTIPAGPPFTVQFQARAEIVAMDSDEIISLLSNGELKAILGHGAVDEPDGCFLRIEPLGRIHSYGIGVPILDVARDPLHAGARTTELPQPAGNLSGSGEPDLSIPRKCPR